MPYGFKFFLITADGEPPEPATVFVTAVPNWRVEEEFMLADGSQFRIVGINNDVDADGLDELYERGINAIWMVEPVEL
jgi:hypothetical protein